ncbi:MAG: hypothetical protein JO261_00175 [Alphaproteobacteria bacterium]|nr:hypothetical protein [Alphaproteobacteria bacterium]MBV9692089.1 hypothetical protein [Alphaproteobacteria bacterium]
MSDPGAPNANTQHKKHDAFDWAGLIIAVLGLIAVVAYTSVSYWQAKLTKQALVFGNQPFVSASETITTYDDRAKAWPVTVSWQNSGNTAALSAHAVVNFKAMETPLTKDFAFPDLIDGPGSAMLIPPKTTIASVAVGLPYSDGVAIRNGDKFGYIWGHITYKDTLDRSVVHITQFCTQVTVQAVTDPPKAQPGKLMPQNAATVPVMNYTLLPCSFHNCSDDDCKVQSTNTE